MKYLLAVLIGSFFIVGCNRQPMEREVAMGFVQPVQPAIAGTQSYVIPGDWPGGELVVTIDRRDWLARTGTPAPQSRPAKMDSNAFIDVLYEQLAAIEDDLAQKDVSAADLVLLQDQVNKLRLAVQTLTISEESMGAQVVYDPDTFGDLELNAD